MMRFLMMALLFYIGYRFIVSMTSSSAKNNKENESSKSGEDTYQDPVCGMYVSAEKAVIGRHDGQRHYFCSMECLEKYREKLE